MLVYATPAQLAAWTGTAESTTTVPLLRSASILVGRATLTATYDVDDAGLPTDAKMLAALVDATCSQVGTWLALAIDPAKGAADPGKTVASKKIGSGQIDYAVYAASAQARADAATSLSQEALLILSDAGLIPGTVVTFG